MSKKVEKCRAKSNIKNQKKCSKIWKAFSKMSFTMKSVNIDKIRKKFKGEENQRKQTKFWKMKHAFTKILLTMKSINVYAENCQKV